MSLDGKTYWIVGASEGLGRSLSKSLFDEGANCILSARTEERLADLSEELDGAIIIPCDVSDSASVKSAAEHIGQVDGVVFCAGVYEPTSVSNWDAESVERMCDINFTGCARVLGEVVPEMAERNAGHIVIVGSLSGFRGLPNAIGYGASKAAVMHLAENLRAELNGSGVLVQLINPGFIKTRLTDKNSFSMPMIMTADEAANRCIAAMKTRRFQTNFPRIFSWLFRLSNFLPAPLYFRLFGK